MAVSSQLRGRIRRGAAHLTMAGPGLYTGTWQRCQAGGGQLKVAEGLL